MAFYRTLATLGRDSGLTEDQIVNTWHYEDDEPGVEVASVESWHAELLAFYQSFDDRLSGTLSGVITFTSYNLADDEPRIPVLTEVEALTVSAPGSDLPSECAVVLSFHGAQASGVNMARRRGRVYLGPWLQSQADLVSGDTRVDPTCVSAIATAADAMLGPIGLFGGRWAVYSPTTRASGGSLDASFHDVVGGWVDNAWDTQRRRGARATSRTTFS